MEKPTAFLCIQFRQSKGLHKRPDDWKNGVSSADRPYRRGRFRHGLGSRSLHVASLNDPAKLCKAERWMWPSAHHALPPRIARKNPAALRRRDVDGATERAIHRVRIAEADGWIKLTQGGTVLTEEKTFIGRQRRWL